MVTRNLPIPLLILASVVSSIQHAYYWTQLPDQVATHFGVDGVPNDWMNKNAASVLMAGLQLGVPWLLFGVTMLASRLPSSLYNIPNREYWLHPDRRNATIAWMAASMSWIALLTAVFMIGIGHLTYQANIRQQALDTISFTALLVGYLAIVFIIAGKSLYRFRTPTPTALKSPEA